MTNDELKLEFNTYYNNITSNQAPGVNDYEMSQFFTLAEEQIVSELYENNYIGFEKTESLRKSLDSLLRTYVIEENDIIKQDDNLFDTNEFKCSTYYSGVLYVVMEWAKIGKTTDHSKVKTVEVIPIKYDDFLRTHKNPFRGVSKKRVIRLDNKDDTTILHSDKGYDVLEYRFEYLKKPNPIILGNPDFEGYTINGFDCSVDVPCELDSSLHRIILLRAVQLAKAAWQSK